MRIRLNAHRPGALADFFVQALGFQRGRQDATGASLVLGETLVDIAACDGQPYPVSVPGWSPLFQHFAITTPDMVAAMARLDAVGGWAAITRDGPQRLPANTGGVTAFKFRDPEGHPLELITFPNEGPTTPPRIDHSAISVADTATSVAFYGALGLAVGGRSLNRGPEQDRLDGLDGAEVEVTALEFPAGGPHVELLCYSGDYPRTAPPAGAGVAAEDVAATRLDWAVGADMEDLAGRLTSHDVSFDPAAGVLLIRDPDGHLLRLSTG